MIGGTFFLFLLNICIPTAYLESGCFLSRGRVFHIFLYICRDFQGLSGPFQLFSAFSGLLDGDSMHIRLSLHHKCPTNSLKGRDLAKEILCVSIIMHPIGPLLQKCCVIDTVVGILNLPSNSDLTIPK